MQKLANELGRRKGHVLISLTGRNGHCDISPYDSRDFLSCEISLRNAMLASTARKYLQRARMAFEAFEDIYAFNRYLSMRGFSLIFRGSLGCSRCQ